MKRLTKIISISTFLSALPILALAQDLPGNNPGFEQLIRVLTGYINFIIPFIVGLGVLVVIYGIFGFISSAGDEEARATAKQFIIWGVIGIFLMLSVWGLIAIVRNSIGLSNTKIAPPEVIVPDTRTSRMN